MNAPGDQLAADSAETVDRSRKEREGVDGRYMVPGLTRGLLLLEAFSADRPALTLIELSEWIGLPRSSVYRLVYTLSELGFLVRDPATKAYRLGARVLNLGFAYLSSQELVDLARPHLEALRDRINCSAHLAVLDGREIVYLARIPDRRALTSRIQLGARLPAHATTMGRAILAFLPSDEVRRIFAGSTLDAYSDATARDVDALIAQLARDRAHGYVVSRSGYEPGIASVAAPIFRTGQTVAGAINITTPEPTLEGEELETDYKDAVVETAATICRWLGHGAQGPDG